MHFPRRTEPVAPAATPPTQAAAEEYRRQARRLRHELRDNPLKLHQSLARLSSKVGEVPNRPAAPPPYMRLVRSEGTGLPMQCDPGSAEAFASAVSERCCSGILRYSQRAELMRLAKKLGIGRFEANLIIATVLHRRSCEEEQQERQARGGRRLPLAVALIFLAEAVIAAAAWKLFG